ncbi:MAG: helix-turn-helix domain-containing protein [Actinomycetota bacterium]
MDDATLARRLGSGLRARRTGRGWTLDEASERLGVSRRLLVQIEQAEANPSLSTLLRVAAGFGIGLSDLLPTEGRPAVVVHDRDRSVPLWRTSSGSEARLLVATAELELWDWRLEPGDVRRSEAHRAGTEEVLSVRAGELVVEVDGVSHVVTADASVALLADRPHAYRNDGDRVVSFVMAVHEPVGGRSG